jgi:quercetin dioxygenase-like cupin family protein
MRSAADIPTQLNCHEEEVTIMLSGECRLRIDGEDIVLRAGDTILIPAFKEHLGEFLTDEVVLVSVFVPRREEFGPESDQPPRLSFLGD